jgi:N-acetylmuramoyl-L-alanine amidase
MLAFIPLVLKSILVSGLLYLYFILFLKDKKLYVYNRYYLLMSVVAALVIPFMSFGWYTVQEDSSRVVTLLQVVTQPDVAELVVKGERSVFTVENITSILYLLVSATLMVMLVLRVVWLYRLKQNARGFKAHGIQIIETNASAAPFSFLDSIYWKKGMDINSEEGQLIFRHELCHIEQKHTLDKLFMQLVLIVTWINPVFWLVRKELSLQHEFIADDAALQDNDTDAFARMILQSQYGTVFPDIIHPFFHSSIKRRLMMLNQTNKTKFSFLRRLMVIPIVAMAVFLLSFKLNKKEVPFNRSEKTIAVVFDAGHGGKDDGSHGVNGIKEKDLNLKVCRKLQQLAADYNIEARMTREDDSYPTLTERTERVNSLRPDLFISIHVNASDKDELPVGYEIVVSEKNTEPEKSKLLASAVSGRFTSINIKSSLMQRGLHVLKESNCPAILIECGNIQNKDHLAMLTDDKKLESFCRNILSGIADYQNSNK